MGDRGFLIVAGAPDDRWWRGFATWDATAATSHGAIEWVAESPANRRTVAGMERTLISKAALATAFAVGAVGLTAPSAAAAPTRDLYMVKNVESFNGVYVGDFAALRKKGKKVVGALGAFGSEFVCVRGKVKGGKLRGLSYGMDNNPEARFTVRWTGSGSNQRIKSMKSVSKKKMRFYGASNPKRMITYCVRNT